MIWIYVSILVFIISLSVLYLLPSQKQSLFFGGKKSPSDILKYVGAVCGAIIVIGTLNETVQTNRLNVETIKIANEANYLNRKAQLDNRFIEANNLLASDNPSENIAGIYALNQIAIDASKDSIQKGYVAIVKNILCAFICENSDFEIESDGTENTVIISRSRFSGSSEIKYSAENGKFVGRIIKPQIVFQTIINVLFVDETWEIYKIYPTNLQNSVLSYLNLEKAHLEDANLKGAFFEFVETSSDTHLESANLSEAYLEYANFGSTFFKKDAVFGCVHVAKANLQSAHLERSNLGGLDLREVNLSYAKLKSANLKQTNLYRTNFRGSHLEYANFQDAKNIDEASFYETYWNERTNFKGTVFENKTIEELTKIMGNPPTPID